MTRAVWTALAVLGAVLVETALGYLLPGPGRYVDPFLLVVVYCALFGGETYGMLVGCLRRLGAGRALRRARPRALSALAKLLLGFVVGLAGARFMISGTAARALTVFLATIAEGLLVPWLASVFTIEAVSPGPIVLLARATVNAVLAGALFALVERRLQRDRL